MSIDLESISGYAFNMYLTSKLIQARHGFFTRNGGVSEGVFASLNCGPGSGDDIAKVSENRKRVAEALGANELVTAHQCHSATTIIESGATKEQADAVVTNRPGIAVGVLTADCVPVLLCDIEAKVIGAAHAGWKGARYGIIPSVIQAMNHLGAKNIMAAVGPCIQQKSFEVRDDVRSVFIDEDAANEKYFVKGKPGQYHFDLAKYVEDKLLRAGVAGVDNLGVDTYGSPDRFFSFRRNTHEGLKDYGRQVSAISL